jgi:hypothetical protein
MPHSWLLGWVHLSPLRRWRCIFGRDALNTDTGIVLLSTTTNGSTSIDATKRIRKEDGSADDRRSPGGIARLLTVQQSDTIIQTFMLQRSWKKLRRIQLIPCPESRFASTLVLRSSLDRRVGVSWSRYEAHLADDRGATWMCTKVEIELKLDLFPKTSVASSPRAGRDSTWKGMTRQCSKRWSRWPRPSICSQESFQEHYRRLEHS